MRSTQERIAIIRDYVPRLRALVAGLTPEQLTTPYNPPEWTIAQNIHHLVESHTTSYLRFKLVITRDHPSSPGYDQDAYAELPDGKDEHIEDSLLILQGLHARWARMLSRIEDWQRTVFLEEPQKVVTLDDMLTTYANHCDAHVRQIQEVLDNMPAGADSVGGSVARE